MDPPNDRAAVEAEAHRLEVEAALVRWRLVPAGTPRERARDAVARGVAVAIGPAANRVIAEESELRGESGEAFARDAAEQAVIARRLVLATDDAMTAELARDTVSAVVAFSALHEPGALCERVTRLFPEVARLAAATPRSVPPEYAASTSDHPLLDHLATRCFSRKLLGLERADLRRFQPTNTAGLSPATFGNLVACFRASADAGLAPMIRSVLLLRDISKVSAASDHSRRLAHNEASALEVRARARDAGSGIASLARALQSSPASIDDVALFVSAHGLVGQFLRGECALTALARFCVGARRLARLWDLGHRSGPALVLSALRVIDACDVASVREGLFDDALAVRFERVEAAIGKLVAARDASLDSIDGMSDRLAETDAAFGRFESLPFGVRGPLRSRIMRLRGIPPTSRGTPTDDIDAAVLALDDSEAAALTEALRTCHLWYFERATRDLSVASALRLLALSIAMARKLGVAPAPRTDAHATRYHVDLLPLAADFDALGPARTYAGRLIDTALASVRVRDALGLPGGDPSALGTLLGEHTDAPSAPDDGLGSLVHAARSDNAVALTWRATREREALLTLLSIYERKNSAAFHQTLKALCDLYGLRKDDFDRIHAEARYLTAMNSARSDKARLCDYVRPGSIVEVGPGGGVVLDLLVERFPDSHVVGLDVSKAVIESLLAKKAREHRAWDVREGDAFHIETSFRPGSLSTVVFCSILHEIYSYVAWDAGEGGGTGLFRIGSVRAIVAAAFRALAPGGRIVVRDGVMPATGTLVIRFKTDEARAAFDLYVRDFEARKIAFESIDAMRVRLSSADAHAFLYTFVWGPASFPYEIREQYGVETYDRYAAILLDACRGAELGTNASPVAIPPEHRSYLQPGYAEHLDPHIELFELDGRTPARLPDSNALWVIEKGTEASRNPGR